MAFLAALSASAAADTIEMKVYGLVCGFCAQGIEKTLRKNPATEDVVVSLEDKLVAIATRPGQDIPDAELTRALTDAGYDVKGISRTQRSMTDIRAALKKGARVIDPLRRNVGFAFGTLLASTATLVCCVLPAVLVSLGAGAVLAGLVSSFPQLVWLSEHKAGYSRSRAYCLQ